MALIRWNVCARTLLTVAALFVCFCTFLAGTGEAKGKTHRLMSIETQEVEIDGRAAMRIQIGVNRADLSYALAPLEHGDNELVLTLEDVKLDKKFPKEYAPLGAIAEQITVTPEGKRQAVLRIKAGSSLLHEDAYRIYTVPGDARGKTKEYLVIDIFADDGSVGEQIDLHGHTVVLDPGHGGSDTGAIGYSGVREKDVALAVSLRTEQLLRGAGAEVVMTRTKDVDVGPAGSTDAGELQARVDVSLAHPSAELFLSVHCNAFTNPEAHGMETYYYPKTDADEHFATLLNEELAAAGGLFNRGVKYARFYLLRHTEIPASLVELGFLSNPDEEALLADADYQEQMAQALFHAIARFFNEGGEEK